MSRKLQFGLSFILGFVLCEVARRIRMPVFNWIRLRRNRWPFLLQKRQFPKSKYEKIIDPDLELRKPNHLWNTAIFFPEDSSILESPKAQLLYYFENAKVNIRMCMQLASLHEIREIILRKKKQEGLLVQVITDYDTLIAHNNWNCRDYVRAGIHVKARNTGHLMHNKFTIIDDEAVMTGSLNQTKQAVHQNYENIVVTTNKKIVQSYMQEFKNIWMDVDNVHRSMLR